jgi:hypothetical protein
MRLKSKYRQAFSDGGAVIAQDRPIEQPIETVTAPAEAPAPAVEPSAPPPQQEPANDAAMALKRQIENLRQSEQAQRRQQ